MHRSVGRRPIGKTSDARAFLSCRGGEEEVGGEGPKQEAGGTGSREVEKVFWVF